MINSLTIEGKVVSDVSLRKSKTEISVVDFRLMHKTKKAKNPVFIDIEVWGGEAERFASYGSRGAYVIVYGEIRRDVWEKDGQERSKIKITASKVIISEKLKKTEETPESFE